MLIWLIVVEMQKCLYVVAIMPYSAQAFVSVVRYAGRGVGWLVMSFYGETWSTGTGPSTGWSRGQLTAIRGVLSMSVCMTGVRSSRVRSFVVTLTRSFMSASHTMDDSLLPHQRTASLRSILNTLILQLTVRIIALICWMVSPRNNNGVI